MVLEAVQEADTPEGVLKECLAHAEKGEYTDVMVLALDKERRQTLMTSRSSGEVKAFLVAFANAWMNRWFDLD